MAVNTQAHEQRYQEKVLMVRFDSYQVPGHFYTFLFSIDPNKYNICGHFIHDPSPYIVQFYCQNKITNSLIFFKSEIDK